MRIGFKVLEEGFDLAHRLVSAVEELVSAVNAVATEVKLTRESYERINR